MSKTPRPFRLALATAIAVGLASGFASAPAFADSSEPPAPEPTPVSVLDLPALPSGSIEESAPPMPVGEFLGPENYAGPVEPAPPLPHAVFTSTVPQSVNETRRLYIDSHAGSGIGSGSGYFTEASGVSTGDRVEDIGVISTAVPVAHRFVLFAPRWIPKNVYLRYAF